MSITWKRAAKLCGADAKELKDWPERLSFEQAAILAAGNRAADFTTALEAMHEAIEQGELPAEDAERPREVRMLLREPDRFEVLHAGPCKMVAASDVLAWLDEQGQGPGEHVRAWDDCIQDRRGRELARAAVSHMGLFQPVETPPAVTMAEAARMGLAGLLASKAIQSPPEFLTGREVPEPLTEEGQRKRRAELAEEDERIRLRVREQWEREQREAVGEVKQGQAAPAKPRGRKPSDAPALLVQILDALEGYAATTGQGFDRHAMPGPLGKSFDDDGSFHWLCASLYPGAFGRAKTTFEKHRAGLCAVAPYAKPTDFYRLALPHIAPKLGVTLNVHHMPKQGRKSA